MSKVTDRDYLGLTAMLRARESKMLDRDRMDRMLNASSYGDAAKLLTDCGYEDLSSMNANEVDAALNARRAEIYEEIGRMAPEPELVDVFRLKYDYHNAKVALKAAAMGTDGTHLYNHAGCIPVETLEEALTEEHFSALPQAMAKALQEARDTLGKTGNPQTADFVLDRAYFAQLQEMAEKAGGAYLKGYVRLLIDAANLRAAVRTVRMDHGVDFLLQALVPGGTVSVDTMAQAAMSGDGLTALFNATVLQNAAAMGVEAMKGGSMTKFEQACDNAVTAYLGGAKLISFGSEPVVEYLAMVETEITAVRMILTGRLAGIEPGVIRERLRDINA